MDKREAVTIVIVSYRPVWEKMRLTLRSVLLQQGVDCHIVVTDDGSDDNLFPQVEQYLQGAGCTRYELVAHEKNQGTVRNVYDGLQHCRTDYVKLISPGDMLYGEHTLADWLHETQQRDAAMSFCDAIYYHMEGEEFVSTAEYAHPQNAIAYSGGAPIPDYLLYGDIALGAAILCKRSVLQRYLGLLVGKVVYAEDNSYRLMAYCGERFYYYPHDAVLYEFGTGISTAGGDVWGQRIRKDWQAANTIMHELPCYSERWSKLFWRYVDKPQHSLLGKVKKYLQMPGLFRWRLRTKLSPRLVRTKIDPAYLEQLRR